MLQKKILPLVFLLIGAQQSGAQEIKGIQWAQGLGLAASTANITGHAQGMRDNLLTTSDFSLRLRQYGLTYTIRAELMQWNSGSISIGSPMMVGFSVTQRYHSTDMNSAGTRVIDSVKGSNFAFDIPLLCDFNFGLHSASDERGRFGVFAGAGYSYSYTRINTSVGKFNFDGFEPLVRAGLRMGRAWENRWSLAFSARRLSGTGRTYGIQLLKEL